MVRSGGGQGHRGHCHPGPGLCPCNKEQTHHAGLQVGAGGAQDCGAPSPGPSGAPHVRGSCRAILPAAQPRLLREAVIALGLLPQVVVLHALAHRPRAHLRNSARHLGPGPLHLPHSHPGRLAPPRAGRCAVAACRLRARAPASHWARPRPQTTSEHPPRPRRHRPRRETKQGQSPHPERTACDLGTHFCRKSHGHPRRAGPEHGVPLRATLGLKSLAPFTHKCQRRGRTWSWMPPGEAPRGSVGRVPLWRVPSAWLQPRRRSTLLVPGRGRRRSPGRPGTQAGGRGGEQGTHALSRDQERCHSLPGPARGQT